MKQVLTIILFSLAISNLYCQKLSPEVISSSGSSIVVSNVSLEWTLGEVTTETCSQSGKILTQGFHQTKLKVEGIENGLSFFVRIAAYPNPASEYITIEWMPGVGSGLKIQVLNVLGEKIIEANAEMGLNQQKIDFRDIAAGSYILKVNSSEGKLLKSFVIIKY